MSTHPTLVRPPPLDPSKSAIENVLELTPLLDIGPDIYTNTRPLWHPPGARGIYGGAVIAQCLSAAQRTVPDNFTVHSMHCYFVLAGNSEIPIVYHVEHVREGRSFATRTVQARQKGQPIFTTTMSFVREGSGGPKTVEHATSMPPQAPKPIDESLSRLPEGEESPFIAQRFPIRDDGSLKPHEKRVWQWSKARGSISAEGGHQEHLSALAYMSDSFFIGTVSRVHNLWRFSSPQKTPSPSKDKEKVKMAKLESQENEKNLLEIRNRPQIGMMVSLDHTIFFHNPRAFRADEWMFTEMESPWAGDGRGLVMQKIWSKDGVLVATCVQEGVVRLKQHGSESKSKL
ncbi:MAG: hypothetical protein M1834_000117 [Cirrosporium novae-zelandiae]|nr:MAG: hypothetical protein M1834_000117 [Cirrosporium novae-zelandiae]